MSGGGGIKRPSFINEYLAMPREEAEKIKPKDANDLLMQKIALHGEEEGKRIAKEEFPRVRQARRRGI